MEKLSSMGQNVTYIAMIKFVDFDPFGRFLVLTVRSQGVKRSCFLLGLVDFDPFCYFCRFLFFHGPLIANVQIFYL